MWVWFTLLVVTVVAPTPSALEQPVVIALAPTPPTPGWGHVRNGSSIVSLVVATAAPTNPAAGWGWARKGSSGTPLSWLWQFRLLRLWDDQAWIRQLQLYRRLTIQNCILFWYLFSELPILAEWNIARELHQEHWRCGCHIEFWYSRNGTTNVFPGFLKNVTHSSFVISYAWSSPALIKQAANFSVFHNRSQTPSARTTDYSVAPYTDTNSNQDRSDS